VPVTVSASKATENTNVAIEAKPELKIDEKAKETPAEPKEEESGGHAKAIILTIVAVLGLGALVGGGIIWKKR